MKLKGAIIFFCITLLLITLIQAIKLEVSPTEESFKFGENITIRVSLLNDANIPINDDVALTIENAEKTKKIEQVVKSNELVEIALGEGVTHGYWNVIANYQGQEATGLFLVEIKELASFSIENDNLIVTNTGNTKYTKTVQIIIGDTIGIRTPKLNVGERISYRLVAPEGNYNIKVTDGVTTLTRNEVKLTGTGKAVGAIDESSTQRSPITGGIAPDEESDIAFLTYIKKSKFIYIFMFVILGAGILLAIEKNFAKRIKK